MVTRYRRPAILSRSVYGRSVYCLIDTGSVVTLIPGYLPRELPKRPVASRMRAAHRGTRFSAVTGIAKGTRDNRGRGGIRPYRGYAPGLRLARGADGRLGYAEGSVIYAQPGVLAEAEARLKRGASVVVQESMQLPARSEVMYWGVPFSGISPVAGGRGRVSRVLRPESCALLARWYRSDVGMSRCES